VLLVLMNDHPSVSETFVVNEAAALKELGVPVLCYALKRGTANRAAAPVDLLCEPPGPWKLVRAALTNLPAMVASLAGARRERRGLRDTNRLLLAEAHAAYIAGKARDAGVTHVHAHFVARTADVAGALSERLGTRWTATAHAGDVYAPTEPDLLRRRLDDASAIACANRGLQDAIQSLAQRPLDTPIVHCGVNTRELPFRTRRSAAGARGPELVTVGRLVPTKGYWTILDAAQQIMAANPALTWTLIGEGPLEDELLSDTRFRDLAPRLRLAGGLDHAETLALIERASAFVLPCEAAADGDSDGIPVALMEAMALGVPVITSLVGGIAELVTDGETGFLVPPSDADALAAAIQRVLDPGSTKECERVCAAARAKVEQDFDLHGEAARLVELLQRYLAPSRPLALAGAGEDRRHS
jgi:glycosyltransferase involved in cell wall biosynthesis